MSYRYLFTLLFLPFAHWAYAQTGCPGCVANQAQFPQPPGDFDYGQYPQVVEVVQGSPADVDVTVLLPRRLQITNPINGTATILEVTINNIIDVPNGLQWTSNSPNNTWYPDNGDRWACVKICGTTFASPGLYTATVQATGLGSIPPVTQAAPYDLSITIAVLPPPGGNPVFEFDPSGGCAPLGVGFNSRVQSQPLNPVTYTWDFGDGTTATGDTAFHNYTGAQTGELYVTHTAIQSEFYLSEIALNVTTNGQCWDGTVIFGNCVGDNSPDPFYVITLGGQTIGNDGNRFDDDASVVWSGLDIPVTTSTVSLEFNDYDPLNAPDDIGTQVFNITGAGVYNIAFPLGSGTLTVSQRPIDTISYTDTVIVNAVTPLPSIVNLSGADTICLGDSVLLESSPSFSYEWFFNGSPTGQDQTLLVTEPGSYLVRTLDSNSLCPSFSVPIDIDVVSPPLAIVSYDGFLNQLSVFNPDNNAVQWYEDTDPIPGATANTYANPDIVFHKYSVLLTNALGCATLSPEFPPYTVCVGGTSGLLAPPAGAVYYHQDTVRAETVLPNYGNSEMIAWVLTPTLDGPVNDTFDIQQAEANGLLFLSNDGPNGLEWRVDTNLVDFGSYFLTPVVLRSTQLLPAVVWDTLSGCVPQFLIAPQLSGTGWGINPLLLVVPNGDTIDVIFELAGIPGLTVTQGLLDAFFPGGLPPIPLTEVYSGDPNGTWQIVATNVGDPSAPSPGPLTVTVPPFEIRVDSDSCLQLAQDQVYSYPQLSEVVPVGQSSSIQVVVPPLPGDFPSFNAGCLAYGAPSVVVFDRLTGLHAPEAPATGLVVYPNPTNGHFRLQVPSAQSGQVWVEVRDVLGKLYFAQGYTSGASVEILLQHVPSGVYTVRALSGEQRWSARVVKE